MVKLKTPVSLLSWSKQWEKAEAEWNGYDDYYDYYVIKRNEHDHVRFRSTKPLEFLSDVRQCLLKPTVYTA